MYAAYAVDQKSNSVEYWILQDDEQWHDVVRGDGASYSPASQDFEYPLEGESKEDFERRVAKIATQLTTE